MATTYPRYRFIGMDMIHDGETGEQWSGARATLESIDWAALGHPGINQVIDDIVAKREADRQAIDAIDGFENIPEM